MKKFLVVLIIFVLIVAGVVFANQQQADAPSQPVAESSDKTEPNPEPDSAIDPDINNLEFIIQTINVTCTSPTTCTGDIRIIPRAQADMETGFYRINEATKLLNKGQIEPLSTLQHLGTNRTPVRLTLVEGTNDTIAEIKY
jgi:hypothetical protein